MTHNIDHELKIILLGESGVGKSSLTHTYTTGKFQPHLPVTVIADCAPKEITLQGRRVKLRIWDTSNHEWFKNVAPNYYDGFLLVYDTTVSKTFDALSDWLRQLREKNDGVVALVVGNKVDRSDSTAVSRDVAMRFASDEHLEFMESSAVKGYNVTGIFEHLTLKILRTKNLVIDTEVNCESESEHLEASNEDFRRLPLRVDNPNFSSNIKRKSNLHEKHSTSDKDINCRAPTPSTEPADLSAGLRTQQSQEPIPTNPREPNAFGSKTEQSHQAKISASCKEVDCDLASTSSDKTVPNQSVKHEPGQAHIKASNLKAPKLPPDSNFQNFSDDSAKTQLKHPQAAQSSSGDSNLDPSLDFLCYDSSCLLSFFFLKKNR